MKKLIIVGASGHGKVVADIAKQHGYTEIVFLDNNFHIKDCAGYPVLGPDSMVEELDGDLFIAVGDAKFRKKHILLNPNRVFPTLIHPKAVLAEDVTIGAGSVVMAGTVINSGARLGKGIIVNTCSSIDHDCVIGDFCHVAVGAHLAGNVRVGNETWIGAGSTIINNINVCENCVLGAGTVVIRDISEPGTYVGVPTRRIK